MPVVCIPFVIYSGERGEVKNRYNMKICSEPVLAADAWSYLFIHHTKVNFVESRISEHFPTFIHMTTVYRRDRKHVRKDERPTISGLVFVQGKTRAIEQFLNENFVGLHLVKDCCTRQVARISDEVMQSFMTVSLVNPTRIRFMPHPFSYYSSGHVLVRITSGVLAGLEGYLVRIARDKCLVTSLGGMTVAIGGVHKETFENPETYVLQRRTVDVVTSDDNAEDLTPVQAEIDRCFFRPATPLDVLAIVASLDVWLRRLSGCVRDKAYGEAAEIALFLLEEAGSWLKVVYDSRSGLGGSKEIDDLCRTADAALQAIASDSAVDRDIKDAVETGRQSIAVRFPYLPLEYEAEFQASNT